jgi:predicted nucleic acid-binding Zn ribbon protein
MSNTTIAFITFAVAVLCSFICANIAQKKGRSVVGFAILGFLVPLIGIIVIAVLKPVPPSVET